MTKLLDHQDLSRVRFSIYKNIITYKLCIYQLVWNKEPLLGLAFHCSSYRIKFNMDNNAFTEIECFRLHTDYALMQTLDANYYDFNKKKHLILKQTPNLNNKIIKNFTRNTEIERFFCKEIKFLEGIINKKYYQAKDGWLDTIGEFKGINVQKFSFLDDPYSYNYSNNNNGIFAVIKEILLYDDQLEDGLKKMGASEIIKLRGK